MPRGTELDGPTRRTFVASALGTAAAAATSCTTPEPKPNDTAETDDRQTVSTDQPPVETTGGLVRGYRRLGVRIYRGIPYAGTPTGTHRFVQAPPVESWSGVRNALNYGPVCPVGDPPDVDLSPNEWPFMIPNGPATSAMEDCLRINIWSPAGAGDNLPVMLWLHADGFGGGSSQKFLSNDGENLARARSVVVASINHRVGPLGFTNLSDIGGADWIDSGNAGMLDIVTALEWIRDNIAAFGGDPDNVTVFGQSGGGFKISVLLAMPAAKGLFHKAIIQSGARLRVHDRETSGRTARAILQALDLKPGADAVRTIQRLPVDDFLAATRTASARVRHEKVQVQHWAAPAWWFEPTAGLPSLPDQPCDPVAPSISAGVPVICGTVLNEVVQGVNAPEMEALGWNEVKDRLTPRLGDKTAAAIETARTVDPSWKPIDVLSVLSSGKFRAQATLMCERLVERGNAPVYSYIFTWGSPLFDGRPRAYHTSDIAFVFANTDLVDTQTGGGPRPRRLAGSMSAAWAEFARTGNPNHPGLADWPAFSCAERETIVFDDRSRIERQSPGRPNLTDLSDLWEG